MVLWIWIALAFAGWLAAAGLVGLLVGRSIRLAERHEIETTPAVERATLSVVPPLSDVDAVIPSPRSAVATDPGAEWRSTLLPPRVAR